MSVKSLIISFALTIFPTLANSSNTLVVGVDASNSAPVLESSFAQKSGQYVADMIIDMPLGDIVQLQTFGEFSTSDTRVSETFRLSRKSRPQAIALGVGNFIASVPEKIASGELRAQQQTALFAWLGNMARAHPCATEETHFLLVSDGLTYESIANAYTLIKSTGNTFPPAKTGLFEGCKLTIIGLGRGGDGLNAVLVDRLRSMWEVWAADAGFIQVKLYNDW